jgi:large subunit ribosomal protein L32e
MAEKKQSPFRKALRIRARAKNKKPEFVRPESWRYSRFSLSWRRPRGLDNKIRRKIKGWPPGVSTGYKGPKVARGLHPSGFREVLVYNSEALSAIDNNTQVARIAHTVGKRKRALIIAEAKKLNIKILNIKLTHEAVGDEEETEEEQVESKEEEQKVTKESAVEKEDEVPKKAKLKPKRKKNNDRSK